MARGSLAFAFEIRKMFADGVKLFLETGKGAHSFFSHIPCLIRGLCCLVLETTDVQQPVDHSLVYFIGDLPVVADSAFTAALEEMNLGQVFQVTRLPVFGPVKLVFGVCVVPS